MLRTPLCDLLGIDVPIVLAPFGPWDQVDLAAARELISRLVREKAAALRNAGRYVI